MLIREFRRAENDEYGENGWLMKGAPSTYMPIGGMGVAHDLLEHRRNDEGSVRDELLAFGAMLYVRGEGGYWNRNASRLEPGEHLGGEMANDLGIKYEGIERGIPDPGRTLRLEDDVEEWIEQAIRGCRSEIKEHLSGWHTGDAPFSGDQINEFLDRARGWLRRGYRMARRRYKNIDVCVLSHLFAEIEKKADHLLKDDMADYCPMVVRLDVKRGNVMVYLDESSLGDEWN